MLGAKKVCGEPKRPTQTLSEMYPKPTLNLEEIFAVITSTWSVIKLNTSLFCYFDLRICRFMKFSLILMIHKIKYQVSGFWSRCWYKLLIENKIFLELLWHWKELKILPTFCHLTLNYQGIPQTIEEACHINYLFKKSLSIVNCQQNLDN